MKPVRAGFHRCVSEINTGLTRTRFALFCGCAHRLEWWAMNKTGDIAIVLRPTPLGKDLLGRDVIYRLRGILKTLGRRFGLAAIDVREVATGTTGNKGK